MFSLIITVISIALVAALAVASVYYGGSALTEGSAKATAATVVSQGQQISGAWTLFKADNAGAVPTHTTDKLGGDVADGTSLVNQSYLTNVPAAPAAFAGNDWTLDEANGLLLIDAGTSTSELCLAIEKNRDSSAVMEDDGVFDPAAVTAQFGCHMDYGVDTALGGGDDQFTVYYSL